MDIKILSDKEKKVFQMREISALVNSESATPSKEEIKKEVCKKLNLHPDATIVVSVEQKYGAMQSTCVLHSYKDAELLKKFEPDYLVKRQQKESKAAKGEAEEKGSEEGDAKKAEAESKS